MPTVGNVKASVCLSTFKSPFHRCRQGVSRYRINRMTGAFTWRRLMI
nr:MAG TPA: hypothetical protein [Caudoviricetes sp.]